MGEANRFHLSNEKWGRANVWTQCTQGRSVNNRKNIHTRRYTILSFMPNFFSSGIWYPISEFWNLWWIFTFSPIFLAPLTPSSRETLWDAVALFIEWSLRETIHHQFESPISFTVADLIKIAIGNDTLPISIHTYAVSLARKKCFHTVLCINYWNSPSLFSPCCCLQSHLCACQGFASWEKYSCSAEFTLIFTQIIC